MVLPTFKQNTILVTYPNQTIKVELERSQQYLLSFLSKKLNNFSLSLTIEVNENEQKKYVYTTREKFEKLQEKYPIMNELKKSFDLDV